ncbi:MAG: hypothetical protein LBL67_02240, partial [Coriobacteriales bacterium]|nr:hypothetical protein [Coriobacteriales bacterium]
PPALTAFLFDDGDANEIDLLGARKALLQAQLAGAHQKQDSEELAGGNLAKQPLDEGAVAALFAADGPLSEVFAHYEPRPQQAEMARLVAHSLNLDSFEVVEAATGVGKSLAYLVPLALFARQNKVTCGVATKTVLLQDQLVQSDLPRLRQVLEGSPLFRAAEQTPAGADEAAADASTESLAPADAEPTEPLRFATLKGYEHYICLRKLARLAHSLELFVDPDELTLVGQLLAFSLTQDLGDLDGVGLAYAHKMPPYEYKASSADCMHHKCRYYRVCFVHAARALACAADIVITNHALMLCDSQSDNNLLPPIRNWAIDEAHDFEQQARSQFSLALDSRELENLLRDFGNSNGPLQEIVRRAADLDGGGMLIGGAEQGRQALNDCLPLLDDFCTQLGEVEVGYHEGGYRSTDTYLGAYQRRQPTWQQAAEVGLVFDQALQKALKEIKHLSGLVAEVEELAEARSDLAGFNSSIQETEAGLKLILEGIDPRYAYSLHVNHAKKRNFYRLEAQAIDVGAELDQSFYPEQQSLVFTSATLAVGQSFQVFLQNNGLDRIEDREVGSHLLPSCYDYDQNMQAMVVSDLPAAGRGSYETYCRALEDILGTVHQRLGGGILTLFTSFKDMEELYYRLEPKLAARGIRLKKQGRGAAGRRVRSEFIEDTELNLFATKSFWEGFDAPGETLRCVIIVKLPFDSPSDPLAQARDERYPNSWARFSLSKSVLQVKQAAGRLIRKADDHGHLIILDSRVATKGYGRTFLASLPTKNIKIIKAAEMAAAL